MTRRKAERPPRSRCRCGEPWVAVAYDNSGTTEIRRACPEVAKAWAVNGWSWRGHAVPGHEFVVTSKLRDVEAGCRNIVEIQSA